MDLTIDEQRLLAGFRNLSESCRKELLDYAHFLMKRGDVPEDASATTATNQCRLKRTEERPEAAEEPIFTE